MKVIKKKEYLRTVHVCAIEEGSVFLHEKSGDYYIKADASNWKDRIATAGDCMVILLRNGEVCFFDVQVEVLPVNGVFNVH